MPITCLKDNYSELISTSDNDGVQDGRNNENSHMKRLGPAGAASYCMQCMTDTRTRTYNVRNTHLLNMGESIAKTRR